MTRRLCSSVLTDQREQRADAEVESRQLMAKPMNSTPSEQPPDQAQRLVVEHDLSLQCRVADGVEVDTP
jgi:hypothetical protein